MADPPTLSYRTQFAEYLVKGRIDNLANKTINLDGQQLSWSDLRSRHFVPHDPKFAVAIIGAGAAGLRAAMLLQEKKIPYAIFEASARHGGRLFTYHFTDNLPHDYFDVGAMRYPDNPAMEATFKLFKELGITKEGGNGGKLLPYSLGTGSNYLLFNGIRLTSAAVDNRSDHFKDGVDNGGVIPMEFIEKNYPNATTPTHFGVRACFAAALAPYREPFAAAAMETDPEERKRKMEAAWNKLMTVDKFSTRAYMLQEMGYPWEVVQWMETRGTSTAAYDRAFSETLIGSLDFDWPISERDDRIKWWCVEGGSSVISDAMCDQLKTKPLYSCRVTSVDMTKPNDPTSNMKITVKAESKYLEDAISQMEFSHVISTVPFSALHSIDISGCNLSYKQKMAIRCLQYGPSVKVGIKFKTRWWQTAEFGQQKGGQSSTDRPSREVVYPSYGIDDPVDQPAVLIASYNWTQDSLRFVPFIESKDWSINKIPPDRPRPPSEGLLLEQIYRDLAALHGKPWKWFKEQTVDAYTFDWTSSQETVGAFAYFGPGQFSGFYPDITVPAANGNFHFGGEVASKHHAWLSGALESAERCVEEIILRERPSSPSRQPNYTDHSVFRNREVALDQYIRGVYADQLNAAK